MKSWELIEHVARFSQEYRNKDDTMWVELSTSTKARWKCFARDLLYSLEDLEVIKLDE